MGWRAAARGGGRRTGEGEKKMLLELRQCEGAANHSCTYFARSEAICMCQNAIDYQTKLATRSVERLCSNSQPIMGELFMPFNCVSNALLYSRRAPATPISVSLSSPG